MIGDTTRESNYLKRTPANQGMCGVTCRKSVQFVVSPSTSCQKGSENVSDSPSSCGTAGEESSSTSLDVSSQSCSQSCEPVALGLALAVGPRTLALWLGPLLSAAAACELRPMRRAASVRPLIPSSARLQVGSSLPRKHIKANISRTSFELLAHTWHSP